MGNFCLAMNMRNRAITQYGGFAFNSMAVCPLGVVGTKSTGLHILGYQTSDNGQPISAFAELFDTDLGVYNMKRLRYLAFGVEGDSAL